MLLTCSLVSLVSQLFSFISLTSWIFAQSPQIYSNYKRKSADGISPSFLLLWFMGDFLSFTSCIFNDAVLKFQIYLSFFFICNDITLCYQYYYYNSVYPRKYGGVEYTSTNATDEPRNSNEGSSFDKGDDRKKSFNYDYPTSASEIQNDSTNKIHVRSNHATSTSAMSSHQSITSSSPLSSSPGSLSPGGSYNSFNDKSNHKTSITKALGVGSILNGVVTNAMPVLTTDDAYHPWTSSEFLGLFLAWSCTFVYVGSRCPQLLKNYERKSVEGISPLLFGAALMGNLTYTLSILTSCDFLFGDSKQSFFYKELPYILGSSGTIVFDIAYFYQRYLYRDTGRNTSVMGLENWDQLSFHSHGEPDSRMA